MDDDDIVLIEEPATAEGVVIGARVPTVARKRKEIAPVVPHVVKDVPITFMGEDVYARGSHLYTNTHTEVGYCEYAYLSRYDANPKIKAACMMHGDTPVFAPTQGDLNVFKSLLEKIEVIVQPGKSLCFFMGKAANSGNGSMVTMAYDGNAIIYGNGEARFTLALNNPIIQPADVVFKQIAGFALRSVKGVKEELDMANRKLASTKAKRHEDLHLYLSDLAPLAGKEDLHSILLERSQNSYEADAREIAQQLAIIAEKKRVADNARSQLPAGRKGVPLRNAYLTAPAIKTLLDYFTINRDGDLMTVIFGFKKPLTLEGIEYGRPEVLINMTVRRGIQRAESFILDRQGVQLRSHDFKGFMHPHVEGRERWCLGTYIMPINSAIMGGNIPMAASLLWRYLSEYNANSPLVQLATCREQMANARVRDIVVRRN